jgi:type III secretion protein Q
MSRPAPLRDRLRSLDAARAERQTRLIAALNARRLGEQTLAARLALERDRRAASAWIRFGAGADQVAIAPLLVAGELVRLAGPDPAIAAQLLAAIEPLIVAFEHALGEDLIPAGLATEPPADALLLRIDATCARQGIRHRLIVAVPPVGAVAEAALPACDPGLLATLRTRWTATLEAPPLPVRHLGTLVPGDLYLLGVAPMVAHVTLPGHRGAVRARLEPLKGSMTLQEDIVPLPDQSRAEPGEAGAIAWDRMTVPATIEIEGGLVSARDVAGLAAGSVLPVPATGGTLAVRVVAGGAVIGAGNLVAVGDGFGVLLTSVTGDPAGAEG